MLSALLRPGRYLTAGLSYLSTAESILMSYPKSRRGRDEERHNHQEGAWQAGAAFPLVILNLCTVIL